MLRRLFFLLPDEPQAQRLVDQILKLDIPKRRIHALAQGIELKTLPPATQRQKNDTAYRIEWFLWNVNLILFMLALLALVISLVTASLNGSIVALIIMTATFLAGQHFAVSVPDVHLTEFTDALSHGEILLMVDVPLSRVAEIIGFVHHKHPEAVVGGVSWTIDAFGI